MLTIEFKVALTKRQMQDAIWTACRSDLASFYSSDEVVSALVVVDDHTAGIDTSLLDEWGIMYARGCVMTLSKGHILNLTQHQATPEQIAAGVVEPQDKQKVIDLLTFSDLPTKEEIRERAVRLLTVAHKEGLSQVMVGGALWLMGPLEEELRRDYFHPLYAYSKRQCVEEHQPDGSVKKTMVFKHLGFIEA